MKRLVEWVRLFPHLHFPCFDILCNNYTFVLGNEPTLIHYYYLKTIVYADFLVFSGPFSALEPHRGHCVTYRCLVSLGSSWLWSFFELPLLFINLIVLRTAGQVLCRVHLYCNLTHEQICILGFGEEDHRGKVTFHRVISRVFIVTMIYYYWYWPWSPGWGSVC